MPSFTNFVRIDSFDDLVRFEEEILEDIERPLSDRFIQWVCDEESGEEIPKEDEDNPFEPGVYFVWYEKTWDRMGPVSIIACQKMPEEILNIREVGNILDKLKRRQNEIGRKMNVLRQALDSTNEEKITAANAEIKDEEFDEYKEIYHQFEEVGYNIF